MGKKIKLANDRSMREQDQAGRLHIALTPISKAIVNPYYGQDIPNGEELGLDPNRVYYLLRHPDELIRAASSLNNIQLLEIHEGVTIDDPHRELVVGSTGTDAVFEHPHLKNSLVIWERNAIEGVKSNKKRQLSASYWYRADMTPGTFEGQRYDGVMRDIKFNHVALVTEGRAGPDVLVADELPFSLTGEFVMPKVVTATSRKALVARGALAIYLKPKLASDAKLDWKSILLGTTAKNWPDAKTIIAQRITDATKGKLAADANIDDLKSALDEMDDVDGMDEEPEAMDEEDDEEKLKAEKEAKDKKARDKKARDKAAKDKAARDKAARDAENETDEEREAREAEDAAKEAEDKAARDAEAEKEMKEKEAKDKKAMDAAIVKITADARQAMRDVREAEDIVKPVIGQVLAQDSALDVYDLLFSARKVDTKGVMRDIPTYRAMARIAVDAATARPVQPSLAHDSAQVNSFATRFPNAAKVRHI